jgi:rhodanese-related sulfurtransferase
MARPAPIERTPLCLEFPPLPPDDSRRHAELMLRAYTDAADVAEDLAAGAPIQVIDARRAEAYAKAHIPGAISFPHRTMDAESVKRLPRDVLIVTYCDGIGCNASTKAAYKLAGFGFSVKELIGGLDFWIRDGLPVESGAAPEGAIRCGC